MLQVLDSTTDTVGTLPSFSELSIVQCKMFELSSSILETRLYLLNPQAKHCLPRGRGHKTTEPKQSSPEHTYAEREKSLLLKAVQAWKPKAEDSLPAYSPNTDTPPSSCRENLELT